MIVVDLGNTNIFIGIYKKSRLYCVYRLETKSKKYFPILIITGGLANTFKDKIEMKYYYEPYLTLQGLYLIGFKKYA